jgi:hypothetical protein
LGRDVEFAVCDDRIAADCRESRYLALGRTFKSIGQSSELFLELAGKRCKAAE